MDINCDRLVSSEINEKIIMQVSEYYPYFLAYHCVAHILMIMFFAMAS